MNVLILLVPVALFLGLLGLVAFLWNAAAPASTKTWTAPRPASSSTTKPARTPAMTAASIVFLLLSGLIALVGLLRHRHGA